MFLNLGNELTFASNNERTGCLNQFGHIFFTTILDVLGKNSGQLLKSLKCGSKWKLLKKILMYNIIIKKQNKTKL